MNAAIAPLPWKVDETSVGFHWTNSVSIIDAEGATVAVLTRGYQGSEDGHGCPSFDNANLIVNAVNGIRV